MDSIPPWTDCEWRPAPGLEGWAVSEDGRAAYLCKKTARWKVSRAKAKEASGYTLVGPLGNQDYLHRLICEAWHGEPPYPGAHARHLDDARPRRNVPSNLAWGDSADNAADRHRNGLYESLEGEEHFASSVSDGVVGQIVVALNFGARPKLVANFHKLPVRFVYDVRSGRRRLASTRRWLREHPAFELRSPT